MKVRVLVVGVLAALSGCVSVIDVQLEKLRIRDAVMSAAKDVLACTDQLKQDQKYSAMYSRLALDARVSPTAAQISDPDRPGDGDVQLGMQWYGESQACGREGAEKFGRIDPELGAYIVHGQADTVALYKEILETRPSYGYINSRILELHRRRAAEVKGWATSLDSRLHALKAEQEKAQAEQRQMVKSTLGAITEVAADVFLISVAVLAEQQRALVQAQQRYVVVTPAYRPVTITNTSCSYVGSILQCQQTSY